MLCLVWMKDKERNTGVWSELGPNKFFIRWFTLVGILSSKGIKLKYFKHLFYSASINNVSYVNNLKHHNICIFIYKFIRYYNLSHIYIYIYQSALKCAF